MELLLLVLHLVVQVAQEVLLTQIMLFLVLHQLQLEPQQDILPEEPLVQGELEVLHYSVELPEVLDKLHQQYQSLTLQEHTYRIH
jgi:hypothetical protein